MSCLCRMIEGHSPVVQALLGTVFTWGLTFLGAAMAVFMQVTANTSRESSERTDNCPVQGHQRRLLDISLGFAAGVMLAASYWSLLEPALEMAQGRKMSTYVTSLLQTLLITRYGELWRERRVGLHSCQYRSVPRGGLCVQRGPVDLQPRDLQPAGPGGHQEAGHGVGRAGPGQQWSGD